MTTTVLVGALVALVPSVILTGGSVDGVLVQLPGRHRIGVVEFARYARASHLVRGRILYPILGIGGAIATWSSFALALASHSDTSVEWALGCASGSAAVVLLLTSRAAPTMFAVGRAPDDPATLARLLDRFTLLSTIRAIFLSTTHVALLTALIAGR